MAYRRRSSYSGNSGSETDYMGMAVIIIILAAFAIAVLYWLAQQAIWIGPLVMVAGLGLYVLTKDSDGNAGVICFLIVIVGLAILLFGIMTTHYFQTDPNGQQMINFSNGVINTSQDFYRGVMGT